jgi:hypothetical protein
MEKYNDRNRQKQDPLMLIFTANEYYAIYQYCKYTFRIININIVKIRVEIPEFFQMPNEERKNIGAN